MGEIDPFLNEQWILCNSRFLADSPFRLRQVAATGWDVIIIDDAYHLQWSEAVPNPGVSNDGVLNPENEGTFTVADNAEVIGMRSYFARLNLSKS